MEYAYYPGCSLHSTGREFDDSTKAVFSKLGVKLVEPKSWICCGSTPAHGLSNLLGLSLPYHNLLEIEKTNLKEVIVPCASCFARFKSAQYETENNKEVLKKIVDAVGGELNSAIKVSHPLEILSNMDFIKNLSRMVTRDLSNLKVACYYGCLLTRPPKVMQFDECEYPMSMDNVLRAVKVKTLDWSYKTDCCGGALALSKAEIVRKLTNEILQNAKEVGANAISVACPLCHANLDIRQEEIEKEYNVKYDIPVFYFTQILALAMGFSARELGIEKHFVTASKLLGNGKSGVSNE